MCGGNGYTCGDDGVDPPKLCFARFALSCYAKQGWGLKNYINKFSTLFCAAREGGAAKRPPGESTVG